MTEPPKRTITLEIRCIRPLAYEELVTALCTGHNKLKAGLILCLDDKDYERHKAFHSRSGAQRVISHQQLRLGVPGLNSWLVVCNPESLLRSLPEKAHLNPFLLFNYTVLVSTVPFLNHPAELLQLLQYVSTATITDEHIQVTPLKDHTPLPVVQKLTNSLQSRRQGTDTLHAVTWNIATSVYTQTLGKEFRKFAAELNLPLSKLRREDVRAQYGEALSALHQLCVLGVIKDKKPDTYMGSIPGQGNDTALGFQGQGNATNLHSVLNWSVGFESLLGEYCPTNVSGDVDFRHITTENCPIQWLPYLEDIPAMMACATHVGTVLSEQGLRGKTTYINQFLNLTTRDQLIMNMPTLFDMQGHEIKESYKNELFYGVICQRLGIKLEHTCSLTTTVLHKKTREPLKIFFQANERCPALRERPVPVFYLTPQQIQTAIPDMNEAVLQEIKARSDTVFGMVTAVKSSPKTNLLDKLKDIPAALHRTVMAMAGEEGLPTDQEGQPRTPTHVVRLVGPHIKEFSLRVTEPEYARLEAMRQGEVGSNAFNPLIPRNVLWTNVSHLIEVPSNWPAEVASLDAWGNVSRSIVDEIRPYVAKIVPKFKESRKGKSNMALGSPAIDSALEVLDEEGANEACNESYWCRWTSSTWWTDPKNRDHVKAIKMALEPSVLALLSLHDKTIDMRKYTFLLTGHVLQAVLTTDVKIRKERAILTLKTPQTWSVFQKVWRHDSAVIAELVTKLLQLKGYDEVDQFIGDVGERGNIVDKVAVHERALRVDLHKGPLTPQALIRLQQDLVQGVAHTVDLQRKNNDDGQMTDQILDAAAKNIALRNVIRDFSWKDHPQVSDADRSQRDGFERMYLNMVKEEVKGTLNPVDQNQAMIEVLLEKLPVVEAGRGTVHTELEKDTQGFKGGTTDLATLEKSLNAYRVKENRVVGLTQAVASLQRERRLLYTQANDKEIERGVFEKGEAWLNEGKERSKGPNSGVEKAKAVEDERRAAEHHASVLEKWKAASVEQQHPGSELSKELIASVLTLRKAQFVLKGMKGDAITWTTVGYSVLGVAALGLTGLAWAKKWFTQRQVSPTYTNLLKIVEKQQAKLGVVTPEDFAAKLQNYQKLYSRTCPKFPEIQLTSVEIPYYEFQTLAALMVGVEILKTDIEDDTPCVQYPPSGPLEYATGSLSYALNIGSVSYDPVYPCAKFAEVAKLLQGEALDETVTVVYTNFTLTYRLLRSHLRGAEIQECYDEELVNAEGEFTGEVISGFRPFNEGSCLLKCERDGSTKGKLFDLVKRDVRVIAATRRLWPLKCAFEDMAELQEVTYVNLTFNTLTIQARVTSMNVDLSKDKVPTMEGGGDEARETCYLLRFQKEGGAWVAWFACPRTRLVPRRYDANVFPKAVLVHPQGYNVPWNDMKWIPKDYTKTRIILMEPLASVKHLLQLVQAFSNGDTTDVKVVTYVGVYRKATDTLPDTKTVDAKTLQDLLKLKTPEQVAYDIMESHYTVFKEFIGIGQGQAAQAASVTASGNP